MYVEKSWLEFNLNSPVNARVKVYIGQGWLLMVANISAFKLLLSAVLFTVYNQTEP